jgi:hypothetical protein
MKYNTFISGLFFLAFLNTSWAYAQETPPAPVQENSLYYEAVVKVDSTMKKSDLFLKAKLWIAQNFITTANYNPIQLEDKENGIITIRISLPEFSSSFFIHTYYVNVSCVGKIQVKDGRFKYTFSDFYYTSLGDYTVDGKAVREEGSGSLIVSNSQQGASKKLYLGYLGQINYEMNNLINSLIKALNEPLTDDF